MEPSPEALPSFFFAELLPPQPETSAPDKRATNIQCDTLVRLMGSSSSLGPWVSAHVVEAQAARGSLSEDRAAT